MPDTTDANNPSRSPKTGGSDAPDKAGKRATDSTDISSVASPAPVSQDLQNHHDRYVEAVSKVHEDAGKKYLELVGRLAEQLNGIQQHAIKSDPSISFAVEILHAYQTQDVKAAGDAYRMLASSTRDTTSTVAKRVGEVLKTAQEQYAALYDETRQSLQSCAEDYSKSVIATAGGSSPSDLDRESTAVLGYGMIVRAITMPSAPRAA